MDIVCGNGWGIGINKHKNNDISYGFPESDNPNNFYPDPECCTPEEIKNWKKDKEKWNKDI